MTIIGKSRAAIAMICDAIVSAKVPLKYCGLKIYNNLDLPGRYLFNDEPIMETKVLAGNGKYFIGAVMPETKKKLVELFPSINFASLINETAFISSNSKIGEGSIVDSKASIASGAQIGKFVTVYANSSIAHDSVLEDFVTVCPNVAICGDVKIGEGSFIGAGAVIKNGVTIGKNCVIGCGAVVINDVEDGHTVYGNPAKSTGWVRVDNLKVTA